MSVSINSCAAARDASEGDIGSSSQEAVHQPTHQFGNQQINVRAIVENFFDRRRDKQAPMQARIKRTAAL